MKTNKEIITGIIDSFDLKYSGKITRNKLIKCWSEYRKSDNEYFKYSSNSNLSRQYSKVFSLVDKSNKGSRESWRAYILRIKGYKYCTNCHMLKIVKLYLVDNMKISKLSAACKSCENKRSTTYRKANLEKDAASSANRRAAKLKRTPSWLTQDDMWLIEEVYSLSKLREECTGIKWHVDHIIPLQGKLVSGLHVPQNLQVITSESNLSKSNRYVVE